jgi:K+-sensing histidine kinase KdpD
LFKGIIALSKGNYKRKVRLISNVFTPYEILFLALEFNRMADEINKTYKQLKHTNKELKKLDEFRSNLIDTVSHEFRTPLTSIKGYTSRLLRQDIELDEETKQKSLKIIKNQSERLSRMVEDLLVIPDIEGAKLNLIFDSVSLETALNDAVFSTKHKSNQDVSISIPDDCPNIIADADRVEQVFINLLENAYKYSHPDTPILVSVEKNKRNAIVTISNISDYIPQDQLNTLFGKFIRIDDKTTRTTRGTGLGLFIVKGLVNAMNGSIELKSTKDNMFSVIVSLPLDKND